MKLILEIRNVGSARSWTEESDAENLVLPADVGRRLTQDRIRVTTQEEADAYGRNVVMAYNDTLRPHEVARVFVSAVLQADAEPAEARPARVDDGRRNIVPGVCPDCHGIDDDMPNCIRCEGTGCICERCGESCDPGEEYCDDCQEEWEDEDADTDGTDSTEEAGGG